ncbi:MAG: flagellar basal body rod protein FlgC [Myxococcota bacterium]
MSFLSSLAISASGLRAERLRVDLASANLANANSTRTAEGGPYRRRDPVLVASPVASPFGPALDQALRKVNVHQIVVDSRPPREVFDPGHPDADANGIVRMPNVRTVEEVANLLNAARSYEANLTAITASRSMAERALRLGRIG